MDSFINHLSQFPTVIFSVALLLSLLFWLINLVGLVEVDILDLDLELDQQTSALANLLINCGLRGVPLSLVLSLISLYAWFICYYASYLLLPYFTAGVLYYAMAAAIALLSLLAALPLTLVSIKPTAKFFRLLNNVEQLRSLEGEACTIRSSRVDANFGEAECTLDGLSQIIQVRCQNSYCLVNGEQAIIVEHVKTENIYYVVPKSQLD